MNRNSSKIRRLLLAITTAILVISCLEVAARTQLTPTATQTAGIFEHDPDKVFRLKANHSGQYVNQPVQTNARGHRDNPIENEASPGTKRVLVIGDSISFGHGVKAEETWPALLEERLKSQSNAVEIINTSAPGNGPMQEYYDLKRSLSLQPDLVILQVTLNDVVEPFLFLRRLGGSGLDYHGVEDVSKLHSLLQDKSALYLWLRSAILNIGLLGTPGKTPSERAAHEENYATSKLIDQPEDPKILAAWEEAMRWLTKISKTTQSQDVPLLVLISPFRFQLSRPPSSAHPQARFSAFCTTNGHTCVDLLHTLQAEFVASQLGPPWEMEQPLETRIQQLRERNTHAFDAFWRNYFLDHDHYNQQGHKLVSELLTTQVNLLLDG